MARRKPIDPKRLDEVYHSIEDFVIRNKRLLTSKELSKDLNIQYRETEKYVDELIKAGRLKVIFEIPRKVRLFIPAHMLDRITDLRSDIPWLKDYSFSRKLELAQEKSRIEVELKDYDQFERLLTATGRELVDAVAHALRWLGFTAEVKEDEGDQDIEIAHGNYFAILEVKGLEGSAKLKELRQISDYHLRKANEGVEDFAAILVVNAHRLDEPKSRPKPFSPEVIKQVNKNYQFITLLATEALYNSIGEVLRNTCTKDDVVQRIKSGALAYREGT